MWHNTPEGRKATKMTATIEHPTPSATTPPVGDRVVPGRGVAIALALVAAALSGWAIAAVAGADGFDDAEQVMRLVIVVAWFGAGLLLAVRRPAEPVGPILLLGTALAAAAVASAAALLDTESSALEAVRAISVGLFPAAAMHLLVGLPTGVLARRSHRSLVVTGYVVGLGVGVVLWTQRPDVPLLVVASEIVVALAIGIGLSHVRYQASRGEARQRMEWFGWAVGVTAEVALVVAALRLFIGWPRELGVIIALASVVIPLSFVPCALRRVLGHVDRLLTHTVSLMGLTSVVVAVYLVIVLGLGRVPEDEERSLLLLSMVAAGVAALLYAPARDRLSAFANRLVYGEQRAPDEALRTFGSRLSRAIPLDELLLQLAESLRKSLDLRAAEVWTGSGGVLERAISVPNRPTAQLRLGDAEEPVVARAGVSGSAWLSVWVPQLLEGRDGAAVRVAPITHSGELLGLIVVERAAGDDTFADDEESALAELARQVGLALHNVQLDSALQESLEEVKRQAEELRASRTRVVAAADAERRKIERDLHDGAQQHLVALAVTVRLARQIADTDPEQAKTMLDELGGSLQEAVQELRNLAHGIYPPVLMDRGLPAALEAAAGRAALPTEVRAEGVERFEQQLEAAVYFCCLEALQNAAKHAGEGATATVTVRRDPEGLWFEVADTGAGFDPASGAAKGHGFVNMSDRLGAIGGKLHVDSAPGQGTRVSGVIPL
jgi:signal transduction histidine kinase